MSGREDIRRVVGDILRQAAGEIDDSVRTAASFPRLELVAGEDTGSSGQVRNSQAQHPPAKRSRAWESRPENKSFTYRIGQNVHDLVIDAVEQYRRAGYHVTTGRILRAWAVAGYRQWLAGEIEIEVEPLRNEKMVQGRTRP